MPLNEQLDWVDRVLLAGADDTPCLSLDEPLTRGTLRGRVAHRRCELDAVGLVPGTTVALRMPPGLDLVTTLLAVWGGGGQALLLDHRLTDAEVARARELLRPQLLVAPGSHLPRDLRDPPRDSTALAAVPLADGRPAATAHCVVQLSSGSTGYPKAIARTAADLERELDCYARLPEYPAEGHRIVLLSSLVHVLGLVGGLLHSLHAGAELVVPARITPLAVLDAVARRDAPTTVLGVPFHAELLAGRADPPRPPGLQRMIVAGEPTRPGLAQAFTERYGVPLGTMYGMTETGVIATDLTGRHHPWLAPVHGMRPTLAEGELHLAMPASPYLGRTAPERWSDGLLHTRDAASIDPATGRLAVHGRRDSQVSIGGLKVDLTEVEQTLTALPGVHEAVVLFTEGAIEAYVAGPGSDPDRVRELLAARLAGYKLPRRLTALPALPRTTTGKLRRSPETLRAHAAAL
ncbi:class I adenylate-forming enzyme family protein [Streptomyces sp. MUSC 125]|uniref:class I adenylate-forming enzyme family protein n=1 Tax=Streptomyces sp. MUSC 125 TaxID=1428624 RepID=UPI000A93168D|nr:fatty acid--CoA ligase family protein [Streptomyces sp. MUSC 125]